MVANTKEQFLTSLATKAYWLVFAVHFAVFGLMLLRSAKNDAYELPLVTWAVWLVIFTGTPLAYFTEKGRTYKFRATLTQCLLVTSLAFGLFNSGLNAVTLFNLPLIALMAAIFFSPTVALKQLGIAIAVLIGFLIAKLLGYLPEITDANWVLNSNYRWTLRTAYTVLFSGVIIYFLQKYVFFTLSSIEDLKILQEAVDQAPDAFVVWDRNDRLFLSNRRYQNLDTRLKPFLRRGITFEDTLRKGIEIGMYPEAVGREEQWVEQRVSAHQLAESNKVVRLDDGRWMNVVESRTSSGYLAGFRTDITALRNSQDLLQATLDSVSEAVVTISKDGRVINVNAASQKLFGYSISELQGRRVLDIAPETQTLDMSQRVMSDQTGPEIGTYSNQIDTTLTRKNGDTFTARVDVRDVEINGQQVFVTFINDLTRQKKFESTVQALGSAVEQLAAGIVLLNHQSEITYSNAYFSKLLDLSSNVAIEGLLADELFKEMSAQIARIDASGSETIQTQLLKFYQSLSAPIVMHTLQEQRLTLRVQALEGGNTILTLTDITQEHDQQRQLEQTNKLATLGEMAAGIAHELNQPLNAIKLTATNLMLQYQRDKSKAEKNALVKLEQINTQIDRASVITDHMRKSARLANEEQAEADIASVVSDTYLLVESSLRLESIEFRTEIEASMTPCKVHPIRLEQVLLNLISNARDAFKSSQDRNGVDWILISARQKTAHSIQLTVADSAGGIPDNHIQRIFDPFFTTKEVGKGTGLGLSISYSIIKDSGGKLSVKNSKDGAVFTLTLPA